MNCPFCRAIVKINGKYGRCTNCGRTCEVKKVEDFVESKEQEIDSLLQCSRMLENWCKTLEEKLCTIHEMIERYNELKELKVENLEGIFVKTLKKVMINAAGKNGKTANPLYKRVR